MLSNIDVDKPNDDYIHLITNFNHDLPKENIVITSTNHINQYKSKENID